MHEVGSRGSAAEGAGGPVIVIFGFARNHPDRPCAVDVADESRTICGRDVETLPQVQAWGAEVPSQLHDRCRFLMGLNLAQVRPPDYARYITCPECSGDVPVDDDGLIARHGQWRQGRHGPMVSAVPCDGAGLTAEDAS